MSLEMMELELITFGLGEFDRSKFDPVMNFDFKPRGGLWSSPLNSVHGWKDYCWQRNFKIGMEEEYKSWLLDHFTLTFRGNIFVIDRKSDLDDLPRFYPYGKNSLLAFLDYEKIKNQGIDALWVTHRGMTKTNSIGFWDCECVFILNPDGIII